MWSYRRMKRLFPQKSLVKTNPVEDRHLLRVPQYTGTPGTLYLTHSEDGDPLMIFADNKESITVLHCILDERLFSDTVFRVVRLNPHRYIVYDLRYLNGVDFHSSHTYAERSQRIRDILEEFHHPDLVALETPDQIPSWEFPIRGYECYDDHPGSMGVFLPVNE